MSEKLWLLVIGWPVVIGWIIFVILSNRRIHPKVLFVLFMVELWERFSYYGMRAFLVFYMIKTVNGGFGFSDEIGYKIYAAYGALVYLTPLLGGFLADQVYGRKKAIIWGAMLMAAGQFTLASSTGSIDLAFSGLALLVLGNGFFKPNISSLIGKFYPQGDPRRDGAFTIFYMGINMGAFLAPLTCGIVAEEYGWKYGFMLAGTGMVIGLLIFLWGSYHRFYEDKADPPVRTSQTHPLLKTDWTVYLATLIALPILYFLITEHDVLDYILIGVAAVAISGILAIAMVKYDQIDRERIFVIVILLFFTTVFWTFFELAGSALNVFTDRNINKNVAGLTLTTTTFQAFNAFFIMLFAPIFSSMWSYLAKVDKEPIAPLKFAAGLLLLGAGFMVLGLGKSFAENNMIPAMFIILMYLLHTWGELALSPVGLSLVTKLAPAAIVGLMMGFWFLSSSIAHQAGGWIGEAMAIPKEFSKEVSLDFGLLAGSSGYSQVSSYIDPAKSLVQSLEVFNQVGLFALSSGVFLLILSPMIKKWMHGVK
jgi:proton-dependent oligopeptide transporter, POT family